MVNKLNQTPLYIAVENGHSDCVKLLIKYGAKVNFAAKTGLMPLHVAAQNGDNACIAAILSEKTAWIDPLDLDKNTPLHLAAQNGHLASVRLLITQGANVLAVNRFGKTAAYLALQNGHKLCHRELECYLNNSDV